MHCSRCRSSPLLPAVQQPADPRGQARRPCPQAAAASAPRVIRNAPSRELGLGLYCVRVEPEHLGRGRAVVHRPASRVAHMVLTAGRRVPPRQRMMRPARGIDDRAVPEDRSHIGTPAPGYDLRRRWQYAEDGACVAASARNVLGAADSTPVRHVSADSDKNARRRGIQPRASAASRVITRTTTGRVMAPVTSSPVTRHPGHGRRAPHPQRPHRARQLRPPCGCPKRGMRFRPS